MVMLSRMQGAKHDVQHRRKPHLPHFVKHVVKQDGITMMSASPRWLPVAGTVLQPSRWRTTSQVGQPIYRFHPRGQPNTTMAHTGCHRYDGPRRAHARAATMARADGPR